MKKAVVLLIFVGWLEGGSLSSLHAGSFSFEMPRFEHSDFSQFNQRIERTEIEHPETFNTSNENFKTDREAFSTSNFQSRFSTTENNSFSNFDNSRFESVGESFKTLTSESQSGFVEENNRFSNMRMEFDDPAMQHLNFNVHK